MKKTPYSALPSYTRWSRAVAAPTAPLVDPVVNFPFRITPHDLVATAGSCFAQHIARRLGDAGMSHYVAEAGHSIGDANIHKRYNYGVFSARFGNIYTSRQLVQLFDRAHGQLKPVDDIWFENGRYFDPFRPAIQPGGFRSEQEFYNDRERHFSAVRTMLRKLDYFVFTLGLTECWHNTWDGVAYPNCPGTIAGEFDPEQHAMLNLTVDDVVRDLEGFISRLVSFNPSARLILTVSPVPLAATALDQHALVATTYSKAVLRVAAQTIADRHSNTAYFPSFEVITGSFSHAGYYADNLRDVTEAGVEHVMRLFFQHATDMANCSSPPQELQPEFIEDMKQVVEVICEEMSLDAG